MSWEQYTAQLVNSNKIQSAVIAGLDGSTWAATGKLQVTPQQISTMLAGFNDPSGLYSNGVTLGEVKYICQGLMDKVLRLKKGTQGAVVYKTGKAVLIGTYEAPQTAEECSVQVGKMADYLINTGF